MKYAYPAIFTMEEDGGYSVLFPDVPHCYTDGETLAEAIENANDVLCLRLYDMEEAGEQIPAPSDISSVKTEKGSFVSVVACDTLEYRKFYDKKAVKKTLTIPNWLNVTAERANVNFSAVLQEALIEKLHLS
ncbi:MAG: type II toxin-antitoxin system HicB family antitoxin [Ruminococcus sp.]|nr:type II toxin-antitoxin system HicB family antitoxin [Ruminococcus sp.]MBR1824952.1 type II toxin-antitoxin system HicB family antitoxin [Ruminococcus sp.]